MLINTFCRKVQAHYGWDVERDKVLNKMCEFCGICSEKSRTPLECEVAGFVAEPPKEVLPNGEV